MSRFGGSKLTLATGVLLGLGAWVLFAIATFKRFEMMQISIDEAETEVDDLRSDRSALEAKNKQLLHNFEKQSEELQKAKRRLADLETKCGARSGSPEQGGGFSSGVKHDGKVAGIGEKVEKKEDEQRQSAESSSTTPEIGVKGGREKDGDGENNVSAKTPCS